MDNIPDFMPPDKELNICRFNVEYMPDTMIQQKFETWDDDSGKMIVRSKASTHHFSPGYSFMVHIEHGNKLQKAKELPNSAIIWALTHETIIALSKGGVNPDPASPERGIIRVSVPKYCSKDEAKMKVVLAVQSMIDEVLGMTAQRSNVVE